MFRVGDIVLTDNNKYYAYKIIREIDGMCIEVKAVIAFGQRRTPLMAEPQKIPRRIFHKKASARME